MQIISFEKILRILVYTSISSSGKCFRETELSIRQSVGNFHMIHNCLNTLTYELKLLLCMKNFLIIISNYHTHKTHSQYIFTHLDFLFSRSLLSTLCICVTVCFCEDTIREQKSVD